MPSFDKTGPAGKGPATGRGQGPCPENQQSDSFIGGFMQCCRGCGRRIRGRFFQNQSSLDEQEKFLESELQSVRDAKKKSSIKEEK